MLHKANGEVGTAVWTFALSAVMKVGSSMVLTRLLTPDSYGVVTMVLSVLFAIEMISDLGFTLLLMRHKGSTGKEFLDTVWTFRFVRGLLNACILWLIAPSIAKLFNAESHVWELRAACLVPIFQGIESLGLILAIKNQQSRVISKLDLGASVLTTIFSLCYTMYVDRSAWGIVIAIVMQKALMCLASYTVVTFHRRPAFRWHQETVSDVMRLGKSTIFASACTLTMQQLDKFVIGRLSPLSTVGIYGIGQNIASMAEALPGRLIGSVVLPRVTSALHDGNIRDVARHSFNQTRLTIFIALSIPIFVGCHASNIIGVLYDARYAAASDVLRALAARAFLAQYTNIGAQILMAASYDKVLGTPSLLRSVVIAIFAFPAYQNFGFSGLLTVMALEPLIAAIFVKWAQRRNGLFSTSAEKETIYFSALVFLIAEISAIAVQRFLTWQA